MTKAEMEAQVREAVKDDPLVKAVAVSEGTASWVAVLCDGRGGASVSVSGNEIATNSDEDLRHILHKRTQSALRVLAAENAA